MLYHQSKLWQEQLFLPSLRLVVYYSPLPANQAEFLLSCIYDIILYKFVNRYFLSSILSMGWGLHNMIRELKCLFLPV